MQLVWKSPSTPLEAPAEPPAPSRTVDYDTDDDGLIEISSLAQLDAMRWDVNGDGYSDHGGPLHEGFPDALEQMGCPQTGCVGYELTADLDFDTNGNGRADSGDAYWNSGYGWLPIGIDTHDYSAVFEGNGHIVRNLHINSTLTNQSVATEYDLLNMELASVGLFEGLAAGGVIRNVGLESVDLSMEVPSHWRDTIITGGQVARRGNTCTKVACVGGLAGHSRGEISGSHVSGTISQTILAPTGGTASSARVIVGGLVGYTYPSSVITRAATPRPACPAGCTRHPLSVPGSAGWSGGTMARLQPATPPATSPPTARTKRITVSEDWLDSTTVPLPPATPPAV